MIWILFKTLLSPLLLPYKISMYGIYTLPISFIRNGLALVGIEVDTSLLVEFMIILYQYTAVAFSFGVTVGVINLCVFYVLGELFDWCEKLLRVDTSSILPTNKVSTEVKILSTAVQETTTTTTTIPSPTPALTEEVIEPVRKTSQLSLHRDTNISRQRSVQRSSLKSTAHRSEADTESGDTTVITTFSDLQPESVSEATEFTGLMDHTK